MIMFEYCKCPTVSCSLAEDAEEDHEEDEDDGEDE